MKKALVIFTATYPLGNKDSFIEGELPYLRAEFDYILLLPVNAVGSLLSAEGAPEGLQIPLLTGAAAESFSAADKSEGTVDQRGGGAEVKCYLANRRRPLSARMRDAAYAFRAIFSRSNEMREEAGLIDGSFKKRALLYYFTGRVRQIESDVRALVRAVAASVDSLTLYSYWLYVGAKAAADLGEELRAAYPEKMISVFSRAHGYDLYEEAEGRGYLPYRGALLRGLDAIFPCSQNGVAHLAETRTDIVAGRAAVHVARLGVCDPIEQAAQISETDRLRLTDMLVKKSEQAAEASVFELVTCAWIRPVKRLDLLAEALKIMAETGAAASSQGSGKILVRWVHFGDGERGEYYRTLLGQAKLAEQAFAKTGDGRIRLETYFLGACDKSFILAYYLHAKPDLFVNCSRSEGVPVSIMEAMGAGIPVLATDVGGTAEIVGSPSELDCHMPGAEKADPAELRRGARGAFVVARRCPAGGLWPLSVDPAGMAGDLEAFRLLPEAERAALARRAGQRFQLLCRATENYRSFAEILAGDRPVQDVPAVFEEKEG